MQRDHSPANTYPTPVRFKILQHLADGHFHSGTEIGERLNLSRAAVWKHIKTLTISGLDIYRLRGRGYRLSHPVELLNVNTIRSHLTDNVKQDIRQLDVFYELVSSNDFLFSDMDSSGVHGQAVLSEYQTKGRGRRNSAWISPPTAGIYLSLGWRFEEPPQDLNCLSLSVGVAVVQALKQFNLTEIGLKWPNDIYCRQCKLGGILVETRTEHASHTDVVIGIGINVSLAETVKQQLDQPVIDIASLVTELPSRNELAANLINRLIEMLQRYTQSGFSHDIEQWRLLDIAREKMVTLSLPDRQATGRVIGIDDDGLLLLSIDGLVQKFLSGQISFKVGV